MLDWHAYSLLLLYCICFTFLVSLFFFFLFLSISSLFDSAIFHIFSFFRFPHTHCKCFLKNYLSFKMTSMFMSQSSHPFFSSFFHFPHTYCNYFLFPSGWRWCTRTRLPQTDGRRTQMGTRWDWFATTVTQGTTWPFGKWLEGPASLVGEEKEAAYWSS